MIKSRRHGISPAPGNLRVKLFLAHPPRRLRKRNLIQLSPDSRFTGRIRCCRLIVGYQYCFASCPGGAYILQINPKPCAYQNLLILLRPRLWIRPTVVRDKLQENLAVLVSTAASCDRFQWHELICFLAVCNQPWKKTSSLKKTILAEAWWELSVLAHVKGIQEALGRSLNSNFRVSIIL